MDDTAYAILSVLPDSSGEKAGVLAKKLGIDKKALLKSCKRLEGYGYLTIRKPFLRDYRISKTSKFLASPSDCRIISIVNHKGGVGKTTTAVNLAACLAKLGKKTLLVDLDPMANASSMLGLGKDAACSIYDTLSMETEALETIVATGYGFDVIPSEVDLVGLELEILRLENREARLAQMLDPIKKGYEYIIIDCPPSLNIMTINALTCSDSILIPVQADQYAIESLKILTKVVELVRDRLNPGISIGAAVITMHDPSSDFSNSIVEQVKSMLKERLYDTCIVRDVRVSQAAAEGKPLIHYDHMLDASKQYMKVTERLIEDEGKRI
ncbi:ParA family protein [Candidatus Altiarchaeota archaeon]